MGKRTEDEQIKKIEMEIIQKTEQKKALIKRKNEKDRKERVKRLIRIGAEVESVFGKPIEEEMIPRLRKFLIDQDRRGNYFSGALLKSENMEQE